MQNLDSEGSAGCELEEFTAHRFLEKNTKALTWTDMRNAMKELDIDFDKKVSLTEFLVHHYKIDWKALVNSVRLLFRGVVPGVFTSLLPLSLTATQVQSVNKDAARMIKAAENAVAQAQQKRDECIKKLAEGRSMNSQFCTSNELIKPLYIFSTQPLRTRKPQIRPQMRQN